MDSAPQGQSDASSEGRRIYLGNLSYTVKPSEIEEMLAANGFDQIESIHISIDPVSAKCPGYCFIDFADRATADLALGSLRGSIDGRPIKVGPCEPKKPRTRRWGNDDSPVFQRWGNWGSRPGDGRDGGKRIEQGPHGALDHFDDMVHGSEGRRLFVGGLGKMIDQAHNTREIKEIFAGFNPTAIGKRITPHESLRGKPGNHHYCFVDFETREETEAAIKALDGKPFEGGKLKVSPARKTPDKLTERQTDGRRTHDRGSSHREGSAAAAAAATTTTTGKAMASSNWRRKDDDTK
ncbi:hypothetical protein CDD83_10895 [Cordyceps sp. RAO-2017]|nr:hypothetical protein CDD83_10895 [Cordyceps sp. RAO-2017]